MNDGTVIRGRSAGIDLDRGENMIGKRRVTLLLLWMWVFTFPLSAASFALRGLEKGTQVRDIELVGINTEDGKLSSFSGAKGLIVIYWATWSSRSPQILAFAEKELRRYEEHGVKLLAINADRQEMRREEIEAVKGKASEIGLSFPVVLDPGLKGYDELGIISTPTTLILDGDLKIVDVYPGFPSIARDDIPDRIDAFLGIAGEKRAEKSQYLLDHKPKNHALQYYNLGKTMFSFARSPSGGLKSVPENAIERLDEAIRRDPDFFRPYLLKTIIFDMAGDEGRRDAVLTELAQKDFQEVYERRVLGLRTFSSRYPRRFRTTRVSCSARRSWRRGRKTRTRRERLSRRSKRSRRLRRRWGSTPRGFSRIPEN
jgi:peroxiredoxin